MLASLKGVRSPEGQVGFITAKTLSDICHRQRPREIIGIGFSLSLSHAFPSLFTSFYFSQHPTHAHTRTHTLSYTAHLTWRTKCTLNPVSKPCLHVSRFLILKEDAHSWHSKTTHTDRTTHRHMTTTHCHSQWPTHKLWVCVNMGFFVRRSGWVCVVMYFCVWRELCYCARATIYAFLFVSSDSSMCVCMRVSLPNASDGKHWLHSNARVVRKPAGSLVLATAGSGTIITVITASVSDWEICQSGLKAFLFYFVLIGPHNRSGAMRGMGVAGSSCIFCPLCFSFHTHTKKRTIIFPNNSLCLVVVSEPWTALFMCVGGYLK